MSDSESQYVECPRIAEVHKAAKAYLDTNDDPAFETFWQLHESEFGRDAKFLARRCYDRQERIRPDGSLLLKIHKRKHAM